MEKPQKTQKEWTKEYKKGLHTPRNLYDAGFRPRSNKYRLAVKEWKYYKQYYNVTLTLADEDYQELKDCPSQVQSEEIKAQEQAEYTHFLYLQNKYGKENGQ